MGSYKFFLSFFLSFSVLNEWCGIEAHVFRTGTCPNVDVVEDFNYEKFEGKWYAIEKSQTSSSCMRYNFTNQTDGSKQVTETYRLFGIRIFNWNDFTQTGQLTVPDETIPAKMTVQFPFSMNPFVPNSFWVMATDYENYAAMWSCRPFLFGHFQSAMILSRKSTLDRSIINTLRDKFEYYGVDEDDLSLVDQYDCTEHDFQLDVSDDDFNNLFKDVDLGPKRNDVNKTLQEIPIDNETELIAQALSATTTTEKSLNFENISISDNMP